MKIEEDAIFCEMINSIHLSIARASPVDTCEVILNKDCKLRVGE